MKTISSKRIMITTLIIQLSFCSVLYAQSGQQQDTAKTSKTNSEDSEQTKDSGQRMTFVKMVDFYLRDGNLVYGKLVSEDKNKIIVEQLKESTMVPTTYSKRDADTRTIDIRNTPEYKYYLELAEYFAGRTWDFRDDPDDFIQAIRCYEKAKQLLSQTQREFDEQIKDINRKIGKLQEDREVWTRETESRAKLRKLEFEAELENKLKEVINKVSENSQQVDVAMTVLKQTVEDMKLENKKLAEDISKENKDIYQQLRKLESWIRTNKRLIDELWRRYHWSIPTPPSSSG